MDSLNRVMNQLKVNAKVVKATIKQLDYCVSQLHIESLSGIKLSIVFNHNYLVINASYLISNLIHVDKKTFNKRLSRWMHTKDGVWALDSLFIRSHHPSIDVNNLHYNYKNHTLWKWVETDFEGEEVGYIRQFQDEVISDGIYNDKTDWLDLSKLETIVTGNKFYLCTDRHPGFYDYYDFYCDLEVLEKLFNVFKVWYDEDMQNVIYYVFSLINEGRYKENIEWNLQRFDSKTEYFLNKKGKIEYKLIKIEKNKENDNSWENYLNE